MWEILGRLPNLESLSFMCQRELDYFMLGGPDLGDDGADFLSNERYGDAKNLDTSNSTETELAMVAPKLRELEIFGYNVVPVSSSSTPWDCFDKVPKSVVDLCLGFYGLSSSTALCHAPIRNLPPNLVSLCLTQAEQCTDSSLSQLPSCLEKLELFHAVYVTDACLEQLPRGLKFLFISEAASITNEGCSRLPPTLETFHFSMYGYSHEFPGSGTSAQLGLLTAVGCLAHLPRSLTTLTLQLGRAYCYAIPFVPPNIVTLTLRCDHSISTILEPPMTRKPPTTLPAGLRKVSYICFDAPRPETEFMDAVDAILRTRKHQVRAN